MVGYKTSRYLNLGWASARVDDIANLLPASPGVIRRLETAKEPWSVNTLAQIAARESLLDATYIKESLRFIESERPRFISDLSSLTGMKNLPSYANFVLIRMVGQDLSPQDFYESLALEGLLIRNCASFKGLGSGYLRVAVKRQEDNEHLCRVMGKLLGSRRSACGQ